MGIQLGQDFLGPVSTPRVRDEDERHAELLAELVALRAELVALLADQPAPQVTVSPPDLAPVLAAVDGIALPAPVRVEPFDYERLAAILALTLESEREDKGELAKALERINKKIGALAGGGSSGSGFVSRADHPVFTAEAPLDTRFEWADVGGEAKPLYQALAAPGTADTSPVWEVQKFVYAAAPGTATGFVVERTVTRTGAWSARATLF